MPDAWLGKKKLRVTFMKGSESQYLLLQRKKKKKDVNTKYNLLINTMSERLKKHCITNSSHHTLLP